MAKQNTSAALRLENNLLKFLLLKFRQSKRKKNALTTFLWLCYENWVSKMTTYGLEKLHCYTLKLARAQDVFSSLCTDPEQLLNRPCGEIDLSKNLPICLLEFYNANSLDFVF